MVLLASATTNTTVTTQVTGDNASVRTVVKSTVNGNTTIVQSDKPGTIHVEKTDESEIIETPQSTIWPTRVVGLNPQESTQPAQLKTSLSHYWITLLRSLWDRFKKLI